MGEEQRPPLINIGCGEDLTIRELAGLVAEALGFDGEVVFDPGKPDGTPRKLLDISRIRQLGWSPRIDLRTGLKSAYRDFMENSAPPRCVREIQGLAKMDTAQA